MKRGRAVSRMKEDFSLLFGHLEWANRALIASLKSQGNVPEKARQILAHILAAEQVWLCRILNDSKSALPVWADLSLDDCSELCGRNVAAFQQVLRLHDGDRMREEVAYVNSKGDRFTNSVGDILLHVCMHGSYHRGQVASLVRAAGAIPINTDLINYVRSRGGQTR